MRVAAGYRGHAYAVSFRALNGECFETRTGKLIVADPSLLVARLAVSRYLRLRGDGAESALFDWESSEQSEWMELMQDDPCLLLVQQLCDNLQLQDCMPSGDRRYGFKRGVDAVPDLERRARWFAYAWEQVPEFAQLRGMALMYKVALMPRAGMAFLGRGKTPGEVQPSFMYR